jgi:hypothetical protein
VGIESTEGVHMIELNNRTRVHGFWFCGMDGMDWLAVVIKQGDGAWEAIWRFRYHKDDKHFDSNDEKLWYRISPQAPGAALRADTAPAVLVQSMNKIAAEISKKMETKVEYIAVNGDGHKAAEALSKASFAQVKRVEFDA